MRASDDADQLGQEDQNSDESEDGSARQQSYFQRNTLLLVGAHGHGAGTTLISKHARKRAATRVLGITLSSWAVISVWALYVVIAMALSPNRAWPLAVVTALCVMGLVGTRTGALQEAWSRVPPLPGAVRLGALVVLTLAMLAIILLQVLPGHPHRQSRLQAFAGMLAILGLSTLVSRDRGSIDWLLVVSGLLAQFFLGFFVLRTSAGMEFFRDLGDSMTNVLHFSDEGAHFLFGDNFKMFIIIFKVFPTIVFFSSLISVLYYLGVLQVVVRILALILKYALGSSLIQSVNAAANLFLGQAEAPLLIKPFLPKATAHEIHCVMVGGFSSISGSILAVYISLGVSVKSLIGASVMSVPGTLVISNLVCPPGTRVDDRREQAEEEAEEQEEQDPEHFDFPPVSENNLVEAAGNGAHIAIDLVLNIGAMLIAFISLIHLLDALLGYLGGLVLIDDLSFEMICGYFFWPVAWILGTPMEECSVVAKLIGTKIVINDFVAYTKLSKMLKHGLDDGVDPDDVVPGLTERAELAATYALCGFANLGSMAVQLGCLSSLCPEKGKDFARLVVSAMFCGNVVCWLTATTAGILT